jgi:hypothetical protein
MKVAISPALVQAVFREMGSRGGKQTMARKSKTARRALARKAALARWSRRKKGKQASGKSR